MNSVVSSAPSRTFVPRAERFPVRLPLQYRVTEEVDWREAQIHNLSGSGLLFETDQDLSIGTRIEMYFPLEEDPEGGATVRCTGNIVRSVHAAGGPTCFAAAIECYRLKRLAS